MINKYSFKRYLNVFIFIMLGIIWGSNFIYTKMAAYLITPLQIVFFRVLFGFIPVAAYAFMKKEIKLSHFRYSYHFAAMGLMATSIYYYCYAKGTVLLLSGVAGAISGAIPIFSFLLAIIFIKEEKISFFRILGVILGFLGVLILGKITESGGYGTDLLGVGYMTAGSIFVGSSFVYARRFVVPLNIPSAALTAYQLGFGLFFLSVFTDYNNISNLFTNFHTAVGLIIGLGLLGTGLAYILYYHIVKELGAIVASSATYLPPVVALFIGSVLVGEQIKFIDYIATGLIFAGVILLRKK